MLTRSPRLQPLTCWPWRMGGWAATATQLSTTADGAVGLVAANGMMLDRGGDGTGRIGGTVGCSGGKVGLTFARLLCRSRGRFRYRFAIRSETTTTTTTLLTSTSDALTTLI